MEFPEEMCSTLPIEWAVGQLIRGRCAPVGTHQDSFKCNLCNQHDIQVGTFSRKQIWSFTTSKRQDDISHLAGADEHPMGVLHLLCPHFPPNILGSNRQSSTPSWVPMQIAVWGQRDFTLARQTLIQLTSL